MRTCSARRGRRGRCGAGRRRSSGPGIERQPQARADPERPLSERHVAILELVRPEPTSALDIAKALGLTRAGVDSSLYSLSTRGLVGKVPYKGWVRL